MDGLLLGKYRNRTDIFLTIRFVISIVPYLYSSLLFYFRYRISVHQGLQPYHQSIWQGVHMGAEGTYNGFQNQGRCWMRD